MRKVIASDMPISIVVRDLNPDVPNGTYEAPPWADPLSAQPHDPDIHTLLRVCNVHNAPLGHWW